MIYLDNAATTQIDRRVLAEMFPYLTNEYGNAGTLYSLGRNAAKAVQKAREQVAALLNAEPEQIVFTSGGTESNNTVFKNVDMCMFSDYEHPSVVNGSKNCKLISYKFKIPIDFDGRISKDGIEDNCERAKRMFLDQYDHANKLVSCMYVNNELGIINDVKELAEIAHKHGWLFHTDCVQAAGSVPIDVKDIKCDFASISSHKIHGPKGVGALYIRGDKHGLILGGQEQEFGVRGGTENVAGIVGFGKACELARDNLYRNQKYMNKLRYAFLGSFRKELSSDKHYIVNGAPVHADPKILSLTIHGVDAETLVLLADASGVCIAAGSACKSSEQIPNYVLKSIGLSDDDARDTIRVSFSKDNTVKDVVRAAKILAGIVNVC